MVAILGVNPSTAGTSLSARYLRHTFVTGGGVARGLPSALEHGHSQPREGVSGAESSEVARERNVAVTDPDRVFSEDLGGVTNSSSPPLGSLGQTWRCSISSSGVAPRGRGAVGKRTA